MSYSISGPYFSVERSSGIVKLIKELDREVINNLETIITITGILCKLQSSSMRFLTLTVSFKMRLTATKNQIQFLFGESFP